MKPVVTVATRLTPEIAKEVQEAASQQGLSVCKWVSNVIESHLEHLSALQAHGKRPIRKPAKEAQ